MTPPSAGHSCVNSPAPGAGAAGRLGTVRRMLGLPEGTRACLFDLDGVLTDTASVHAAAWKQMFDEFLRARAERDGTEFVPFDGASPAGAACDGPASVGPVSVGPASVGAPFAGEPPAGSALDGAPFDSPPADGTAGGCPAGDCPGSGRAAACASVSTEARPSGRSSGLGPLSATSTPR